MYKVLVVDDEPIAVESVMVMIKRNFPGVFAVESCRSGKLAIEKAAELHPDIVIMDIDMPGINGLDAIRRIQESRRDIAFIILSAFDYFNYAQEALSLGVAEYLVKPVKEARLAEVLNAALLSRISSSTNQQEILEQQERLLLSIPVLEKSFCEIAALGREDSEELRDICRLLGFDDVGGYVLFFQPSKKELFDFNDFHLGLKNSCDFVMGQLHNGDVLLYVFRAEDGEERKAEADGIARRFIGYAQQKGRDFACGVGGWQDTAGKAGRSCVDAKNAAGLLSSKENREAYGQVLDAERAAAIGSHASERQVEFLERSLPLYLEQEDIALLTREYAAMIAGEQGEGTPFHEIRNIVADLELQAGRHFDIPVDQTRGNIDRILGTEDAKGLQGAVEAAITQNAEYLAQRRNTSAENVVEKAKQYILSHYAEPITLEDVAKNANLSQYYFSRIFKQETGAGFQDYLTRVRIENSKKLLLMQDLTIKEVAYMAGFNDPNYFSKAFKKTTGQTPGEYKKR